MSEVKKTPPQRPNGAQGNPAFPGDLIRLLGYTADKTQALMKENSVVGERIDGDGVTVIPVSKLSVGFAGGGADISGGSKKQQPAGAGAKVSLTPVSFVVIKDGSVRLISVDAPEGTGLASVIPAVVEQIKNVASAGKKKKKSKA